MGWEWRVFVPARSAAAAAGLVRLLRDAAAAGARGATAADAAPLEVRDDLYLLGCGAAVGVKLRGAAGGAAPGPPLEAKLEVDRDAASGAARLTKTARRLLRLRKRRWPAGATDGEVCLVEVVEEGSNEGNEEEDGGASGAGGAVAALRPRLFASASVEGGGRAAVCAGGPALWRRAETLLAEDVAAAGCAYGLAADALAARLVGSYAELVHALASGDAPRAA